MFTYENIMKKVLKVIIILIIVMLQLSVYYNTFIKLDSIQQYILYYFVVFCIHVIIIILVSMLIRFIEWVFISIVVLCFLLS